MPIERISLVKQYPRGEDVQCVPGKKHTQEEAKFFGVFHELGIFHPSYGCPHCSRRILDENVIVH